MIPLSVRADFSASGEIIPLVYSLNGQDIRVDRILSCFELSATKVFICRCGNEIRRLLLRNNKWYLTLE